MAEPPDSHQQLDSDTYFAELRHLREMLLVYDRRYTERFEAAQRAIDLGLKAQQDLVSAAFASQKDAVSAALAAADRATAKAELAAERRFESVNEFRASLADQQRTLMPREETRVVMESMAARIQVLERRLDKDAAERTGVQGGWGYAVGAIGFIATMFALWSGLQK